MIDEFAKEPFGWEFEVVRLLVLSLLRAGAIEGTSKGQTIDSVTGIEAPKAFGDNNLFRQASFRPKKGVEFEELVKAAEAFRDTFGTEVRELNAGAIVAELRTEIARHEDTVTSALAMLTARRLPGGAVLDDAIGQLKAILRGSEDNAIATFNASHRAIKDAIRRAVELEHALIEPRLHDLERAHTAQANLWSFLSQEADIAEALRSRAAALEDLLARETFFKELAAIEEHTTAIEAEYRRRFDDALEARATAYDDACDRLAKAPSWLGLPREDRERLQAARDRLVAPFELLRNRHVESVPIPQLRSERDACEARLRMALAELNRIIDGDRVVTVNVTSFFAGGIESEEQLDAALDGFREECARLIGAGKKVFIE